MGAFCVFGVSRSACRTEAERKIVAHDMTLSQFAAARDALAEKLFEEAVKAVRISPEFDAPQFAHDWMAVSPNEIKLAKVMVRGPKFDGGGKPIKRNGTPVMTWHEYTGVNQFMEALNNGR